MADLDTSVFPPRWKPGQTNFKPTKASTVRQEQTSPTAKPTPKVVEKVAKERKVASLDRAAKEAVRKRDGESCRVCGRKSREVNERLMKSRGGVASLDNSCVMCRQTCHRLFHGHAIKIVGESCNSKNLKFLMNAATARLIFGAKATPKHVEVTQ